MNLKIISCFTLTIFSVSSVSNAVQVDWECSMLKFGAPLFKPDTCAIYCSRDNCINVGPDDSFNIVDTSSQYKAKKIVVNYGARIYSLPVESFQKFPFLEMVRMERNLMESLVPLRKEGKLSNLYLAGNKIKTVSANFISLASKLEFLDLSRNKISDIGEHAFNSSSLLELYLSGNKIKMVSAYAFFLATKLRILDLTENQINDIEDYTFNSSSLYELKLSKNKLKTIKKFTLCNNPLKTLRLDHNCIENIEDGAFDLYKLEDLHLNGNNLKSFEANLFANAPRLNYLNIGSNELSTEALPALEKATELRTLAVSSNPTLSGVNVLRLRLPNLRELRLNVVNVTYSTSLNPTNMPQLENLHICFNNLTDRNFLNHLGTINNLKTLDIVGNAFTELDDFNRIKSMFPSLTYIDVGRNPWNSLWLMTAKKICKNLDIRLYY